MAVLNLRYFRDLIAVLLPLGSLKVQMEERASKLACVEGVFLRVNIDEQALAPFEIVDLPQVSNQVLDPHVLLVVGGDSRASVLHRLSCVQQVHLRDILNDRLVTGAGYAAANSGQRGATLCLGGRLHENRFRLDTFSHAALRVGGLHEFCLLHVEV